MLESMNDQRDSARGPTFRALHESCFVLPNAWDVGSARMLEQLGFRALATTSGGLAFSRGLPDGGVPLEGVLAHLAELVEATELPVSADFEAGFADTPEGVHAHVARALRTGIAGISIEDATYDKARPLYDREVALARFRAAREAVRASGRDVVLTARCEAFLVGAEAPLATALDRLSAFAEAGADCLYAPAVRNVADIEALVRAVHPLPLNVLISAPVPGLTVARLRDLGVRRISVGSAFARAAWGGFLRAARTLLRDGSFEPLADATPFAELNDLFGSLRRA